MDLIYSIERVFGDYLKEGQFYNIPEYQRGYKWSDQQINQLLTDINEFETGGDEDLFYCLQNITIVPDKVESSKLNVVDGQQRLTTITLLMSYLKETETLKNKIRYAVREPSNEFIQRVISHSTLFINDILDSSDFAAFVESTSSDGKDYDYQDIYFMYSAIRTMNKWFLENEKAKIPVSKKAYKEKLLKNVKLIVNRIENVAEQELFMNLNAGRVHLDGSDLVRAILITRVAKKEMEEYDASEVRDVVKLNERRIRIGWELDEINTWWSKKEVQSYFSYFTKLKTGEKESIKFDHDKHPINLLYKLWAETIVDTDGKRFTDIRLSQFEAKNTNALDLYLSIILIHRTLKDWYEDREIYHYLGFLFTQNSATFKDIWDMWLDKKATRAGFIQHLKVPQIREAIFEKEPNGDDGLEKGIAYWLSKIKDYGTEGGTNWYELPNRQLEKILLALDVIEHAKNREEGTLPHIKPIYFKNHKEDKEHIYPCTPKAINDIKNLPNPMGSISAYILELNKGYQGEELIIWDCQEDEWKNYSDDDKKEKLDSLKALIHKKRPINSIGNLVLLHQHINRGFGNDYYADKRQIVVNHTEEGLYVRNHTLKVFVKQTENRDLNHWTMTDITQNADRIHDILKGFFNFKTPNTHGE